LAFTAIAAWVVMEGELPGDRWVLTEFHAQVGSSIDEPMLLVGDLTDTLALGVVVVIVSAVLWLWSRRLDAVWFLLAVGVVFAVNPVLKEVVGRPRPDIRPPPESLSPLSFPSGHASGTAALVGALVVVARGPRLRRFIILSGAVLVGLVAFALLALTAHYPSDIVAGWAWSGSWILWVASAKHDHDGCALGREPTWAIRTRRGPRR
jgi:undecaprenyl-diphosphatase